MELLSILLYFLVNGNYIDVLDRVEPKTSTLLAVTGWSATSQVTAWKARERRRRSASGCQLATAGSHARPAPGLGTTRAAQGAPRIAQDAPRAAQGTPRVEKEVDRVTQDR